MRVLFVCLGNICRSPAAEAVVADLAAKRGFEIEVDSAGTADYHVGDRPHHGTLTEAGHRGVPIGHRGRQATARDFHDFDLLVAMDRSNLRNLRQIAPAGTEAKAVLFGDYAPNAAAAGSREVDDPWGHGPEAFTAMWDHLEELANGLLDAVADPSRSATFDA